MQASFGGRLTSILSEAQRSLKTTARRKLEDDDEDDAPLNTTRKVEDDDDAPLKLEDDNDAPLKTTKLCLKTTMLHKVNGSSIFEYFCGVVW